MIPKKRIRLSAMQRVEVWRRWKAGESLHAIGRALGKNNVVIYLLLKRHGGIAPPIRRRSPSSLTLAEREDISRGIACGSSIRGIAQGLHRCASTISREVARHGGRAQYRANEANQQAWKSALRPKPCLLATHTTLREIVASKLMQDWSPEQVSGWLKWQFPQDEGLRVSHETIYRSLFLQARGALKKELIQHLRSKRRIRRSRHSSVHGHSQGKIVDAISIRERPAEVEDRAIPGHWEGDLLRGARNSHVATLVERHSRFCLLVKVPGKDTTTVVAALSRHVRTLPATLRRSLTWDRGLEMAQHKSFTMATDEQSHFRHPQSPWSAVRTKTRTGCCGNTCRRRRICPATDSRTWTRSLCASVTGHEKHWDLKLRRIDLQASVASTLGDHRDYHYLSHV